MKNGNNLNKKENSFCPECMYIVRTLNNFRRVLNSIPVWNTDFYLENKNRNNYAKY